MSTNKTSGIKKSNENLPIVAAGVTGAVIGAGIGIIAAIAMRDEKTKQKTKEALYYFKDYIMDNMRNVNIQTLTTQDKKQVYKKLKAKAGNSIKQIEAKHDLK